MDNYIFTVAGVDGFLLYKIPSFYLIGEWFFGFIIILYILFPTLRYLVIKYPVMTVTTILAIYFVAVGNYQNWFEINVKFNPVTILPEFVFGMILSYYIGLNRASFFFCSLIGFSTLFIFENDLPKIVNITFFGTSSFYMLAYLLEHLPPLKLAKAVSFLSSYSSQLF